MSQDELRRDAAASAGGGSADPRTAVVTSMLVVLVPVGCVVTLAAWIAFALGTTSWVGPAALTSTMLAVALIPALPDRRFGPRATTGFLLSTVPTAVGYAWSDGAIGHWWPPLVITVVGETLVIALHTRRLREGLLVTAAHAVAVAAAMTVSGRATTGQLLVVVGTVLALGMTLTHVAATLGRTIARLDDGNRALAASELRARRQQRDLAQVLDHLPSAVLVSDPTDATLYSNRAFADWSFDHLGPGVGRDGHHSLEGLRVVLRGTDVPYDRERLPTRRALRGEAASVDDIDVVLSGAHRRPGRRSISWQSAPILDESGRIASVVSVFSDVTEQVRADEERLERRKLEAVSRLAAGIAHEINTPMQYIGDNTRFVQRAVANLFELRTRVGEILLDHPDLVDRVSHEESRLKIAVLRQRVAPAIDSTIEGIESVTRTVAALEDFARPGSDDTDLVDLNRSIETVLELTLDERRGVADVELALDPRLPLVPCRESELNQVLVELVVNAVDAIAECDSHAPDGRGTISISSGVDGDHVEIVVADTGCGIPDQVRHRIFDPFFTTKEVGRGAGQGLAIGRSVVDRHGGSLEVAPRPGGGAIFSVRLPLAADGASEPADERFVRPELTPRATVERSMTPTGGRAPV